MYPVATKMKQEIVNNFSIVSCSPYFISVCDIMVECVKEYEHGTAETSDCEGVSLEQYRAVLIDFLHYLHGEKEECYE
jgi:hypothetical protein